ncbi:glucose transporter GlcU [Terrilactibacillus sp. BCM23-1]|uniref:Glucose transporter GlcU n=1 Tax=Terrilactibacillus tamarindi TaxID=2599694 RepID=A0A6N8CQF5_9BACI|nr:GRP family sugar transporter [Terrilactibacillus tamarindi]MTT31890.1 glucose transporter GlcU [Terrilactibacillus tamarindi]
MDFLLGILPSLSWGSMILVSMKMGGGPFNQTMGTTLGALILSIAQFIIVRPELTPTIILVGIISGLFWSVGQSNQFKSVPYLGVSKSMPISTGMQLVTTALFGVIVFKEWSTLQTILLGSLAIIFIIIGVVLTSIDGRKQEVNNPGDFKKGIITLTISSLGFLGYVVFARIFHVDGWVALFPQAIGMLIGSLFITLKHKPFNLYTVKNILPGLIWASGNLFLFMSQSRLGVATSFSLSQMGIIISIFGGIVFLGEKKTKRQLVYITVASILIISGGVFLGIAKA